MYKIIKGGGLHFIKMLSPISPKLVSSLLYVISFKKRLDLKHPVTLNEKLMWLKLNAYHNNPLITQCTDKYKVREYVKQKNCGEILNELIDSWDSVDEIDWDSLPNKFVLKCNHGCGYNIICDDKSNFDVEDAKRKLKDWMKDDYWKLYAELNYKFIKKKIICEKYIETNTGLLPADYKVYCFNGVPKYVMFCAEREKGAPKFYYFDTEWNIAPLSRDSINAPVGKTIPKPKGIDEVFKYARLLSKPFPFVRADFYLEGGKPIFGELTFTPGAALDNKRLKETDLKFGSMVKLPE